MKSIGVVICNYNKCEYSLRCIKSVLESDTDDFTIYFVDNGSTDNSVHKVREKYGNEVVIIENGINMGSAGGFNSGIKRVLSAGHNYVMLIDNDVQIDDQCIINMRDYLIHNPETGMVGAKIYHQHDPSFIQQFGSDVDLKRYQIKTFYADVPDSPDIPQLVECTTLSTTTVMLPTNVIKSVGLIPEEYFMYWDDMDWGYRINKAGYKLIALGNAKAIHEMAPFIRKEDTSSLYYQWRNAIHFFMKYTPEEKWENMTLAILNTLFHSVYECSFRNEKNMVTTIMRAYHDALYQQMGKAQENIILPNDENHSRFTEFFDTNRSIFIEAGGDWLIPILRMEHPNIHFAKHRENADIVVRTCDNIFIMQQVASNVIYVDRQLNIIASIEDEMMMDSYAFSLDLFLYMHQSEFIQHIKESTHM